MQFKIKLNHESITDIYLFRIHGIPHGIPHSSHGHHSPICAKDEGWAGM
jgi:hypothetical protein